MRPNTWKKGKYRAAAVLALYLCLRREPPGGTKTFAGQSRTRKLWSHQRLLCHKSHGQGSLGLCQELELEGSRPLGWVFVVRECTGMVVPVTIITKCHLGISSAYHWPASHQTWPSNSMGWHQSQVARMCTGLLSNTLRWSNRSSTSMRITQ